MEWWNLGIVGEMYSPLEGRALSRPATTKRGPPYKAYIFSTFHCSVIPSFQ
jgi:hypothetical protein